MKKTEYSVFYQSLHGAKLGTQEVPLAFNPRTTSTYINLLISGLQGFTSSVRDLVYCFLKLSNQKWKMDVLKKWNGWKMSQELYYTTRQEKYFVTFDYVIYPIYVG